MSRIDIQRNAEPQIVADVRMYATGAGGRLGPTGPGWGCLVTVSDVEPRSGWDALPLLRDAPLFPGETRRVGFVFLSPEEAVAEIAKAGHFYLWEGRCVGEAIVVVDGS